MYKRRCTSLAARPARNPVFPFSLFFYSCFQRFFPTFFFSLAFRICIRRTFLASGCHYGEIPVLSSFPNSGFFKILFNLVSPFALL